ncbi:uncharacterized protein [Panulirus ornatus]|uniref:uncharacterized protein n=1 Tax=Panulirus ornatus TaxID=150431 RepID=UPI003A86A449
MARFITNKKGENDDALRHKMKNYWEVYSPTLESMMLSHDTAYLAENEQNEILSYLPNYSGKDVLELGAGIGRFTSKLAPAAGHLTTVDFMQEYIDENQRLNQHLKNVTFVCKDVTKLDFPAGSFDLVFSNWLFMYLSDSETFQVFQRIINWLKPDGYFFLRESCYHQSGNVKRNENPTLYRTPYEYFQMLQEITSDDKAVYRIIRGKSILAYIHHHGNPNQLCFLTKKVDIEESDQKTQFLESRYSLKNILAQERIYGYNWFSGGGETIARDFCLRLGLRPGQQVLDIGCGTGGSAVFMARHYGVQVHGVDLSTSMIYLAIERQGKLELELKKKLQFEISDILKVDYVAESYDAIHSRDCFLHIQDKQRLFKKLYRWLRPGGKLLITDFCRCDVPTSEQFLKYTDFKRYSLSTIKSYQTELEEAGFENVSTEDLREDFIKILESGLKAFITTREAFIKDFSQKDFDDICSSWTAKIHWAGERQLTWGTFTATKPEDTKA